MTTSSLLRANPFALMVEPQCVQDAIACSKSLNQLRNRKCHPLDREVIRSASAELAAWDGKIDRKTRYLAPEEAAPHPVADEPIPDLIG